MSLVFYCVYSAYYRGAETQTAAPAPASLTEEQIVAEAEKLGMISVSDLPESRPVQELSDEEIMQRAALLGMGFAVERKTEKDPEPAQTETQEVSQEKEAKVDAETEPEAEFESEDEDAAEPIPVIESVAEIKIDNGTESEPAPAPQQPTPLQKEETNADEADDTPSDQTLETDPDASVAVTIPQGSSAFNAAQILQQAGVVEDAADFTAYLLQNDMTRRVMTGEIVFPADVRDFAEISRILSGRLRQ